MCFYHGTAYQPLSVLLNILTTNIHKVYCFCHSSTGSLQVKFAEIKFAFPGWLSGQIFRQKHVISKFIPRAAPVAELISGFQPELGMELLFRHSNSYGVADGAECEDGATLIE